jgi:type IV secretory pathway VirB10-like protein
MAFSDILQKILNSKPQPQMRKSGSRIGTLCILAVLALMVGYTTYSELLAPRPERVKEERGVVYANTAPVNFDAPATQPEAEKPPTKEEKPQGKPQGEARRKPGPPAKREETLAQKCRRMARLHSQYSGPYARAWKVSDCLADAPPQQASAPPQQVLEVPSAAANGNDLQSHPPCTILRGAVIPVILQDEIKTQTPGQITAKVTQDVRGWNGNCVVIPEGAEVVGYHDTRLADYQTQLPTGWEQLNFPNGLTKSLANYPGASRSGAGGVDLDKVNTHFWRRVGSSALLTLSGAASRTALSNSYGGGSINFNEALAAQGGMEMNRQARQTWGRSGYQGPEGTTFMGKRFLLQVTKELSMPGDYYQQNGGRSYAATE